MAVSVSHLLPVKKLFFFFFLWVPLVHGVQRILHLKAETIVLNQSKLLAVKIMSDFGDRTLRFQHRKL